MQIHRESIFVSALRGFFKSFFVLLGIFAALFIAIAVYFGLSSPYSSQENTSMEILPDLNWKKQIVSLSAPAVLQINIHGVIGDPEKLDSNILESILVDSRNGFLMNDRVKAVLLHFDTPGGTVSDSDNIYRMILKYKKQFNVPVYGYIDGMCASGGMYIASAADKLFCSHSGVVGSVGVVIGPFFNFYETIGKIGMEAKTLTQGLDKDMMNPFRPWKPDEDASLNALTAYFYQQFVDVVLRGRPQMSREKLIHDYGAKVFDGPTAQEYGYVDVASSSYNQALLALMQVAGIDENKPYQVVQLKPEHNLLAQLVRGSSPLTKGRIEHRILLGPENAVAIQDRIAYLYRP